MRALLIRLEAPLMSFGGPQIDQKGVTRDMPGLSQLTGLFANALGWTHADSARLQRLQTRLNIASALIREGSALQDYQTVDLGAPWMMNTGWTSDGAREDRGKGEATTGTHIRLRQYCADAEVLAAVALDPADEDPALDALAAALDYPARPLFIGRKPCIPSVRLNGGFAEAPTMCEVVRAAACKVTQADAILLEWPASEDWPGLDAIGREPEHVVDRRDWRNQFHGGERTVHRARISARVAERP